MGKFDKVHLGYDRFMKLFGFYEPEWIIEALDLTGTEKIIDIGGGTGFLAARLSAQAHSIIVLDESPGMLSHNTNNNTIRPVVGNALKIPFPDHTFQVALLCDVVHHIRAQETLLAEAYRILKKGGRILILDFDRSHFKTSLLHLFEVSLFGRLFYRTTNGMRALLQDNGFTISKQDQKSFKYLIKGNKDD